MLAIIVIQWHILVNGFFHAAFENKWEKIHLSLTHFVLADFASAVVLITFGAILGKVTKPSQLVIIALLEIVCECTNFDEKLSVVSWQQVSISNNLYWYVHSLQHQ